MNRFKTALATVVIAGAGLFAAAATANAAAPSSSGNGMKVTPVRQDLVISPGQSKTVTVSVQNVTGGTEVLKVVTNDFVARDETGAPSLLLSGQANPRHGLRQFITVPATVTVPAGQQKEINVVISIPKDAGGGGYYGAVRFAPAGDASDPSKQVSLSGSVGSLILVSVPGDVTENLQVASFEALRDGSSGTFFTSGDKLTAMVRIRNTGNVQEQPYGKILLKKGDKTLGTYEINNTDPRGNVLPDSIRRFSVNLSGASGFGKYKLEGNFGYGSNGQLISAQTNFYVVPIYILVPIIILIVVIVLGVLILPRMIRRYNQRILRRAGRRR